MFKIIKKTAVVWHHEYNGQILHLSSFGVVSDNTAQTFILRSLNGSYYPREAVNVTDIIVIDETDASVEETFATIFDLEQRLVALNYTPYAVSGGGSGATEFTQLTDVPNSYSGQAGKVATVKSTEDGLEFTNPTAGAVGTLQQVTDNGNITTNPITITSPLDGEITLNQNGLTFTKDNANYTVLQFEDPATTEIPIIPNESGTLATRYWTNLQGFITNVITALGFTPENSANKSNDTADASSTTKFPVWSAVVSYFSASRIRTILGITTLSGSNTGDETTSTIQTKRPLKTVASQSLEGSGNVALSKSDVGLGNVDNTSDANKPISTATQTALNLKEDTSNKGAVLGNLTSTSIYTHAKGVVDYVASLGYWVAVNASASVAGIAKLYTSTGSNTDGSMTQNAITTALSLRMIKPTVVSSSFTALIDTIYQNVGNATYTDPTPTEGRGYTVLVLNGTATVGGVGYNTPGLLIYRMYQGSTWTTRTFVDQTIIGSATQSALALKSDLANTPRILKSTFTGNAVTTTETVVGTCQVGGIGLGSSFSLKCFLRSQKSNTTSQGNLKFYLNSTPDLSGSPVQIAINASTSAIVIPLERTFSYSGGNLYGWNSTNNAPTDVANATVAETVTAVDMTTTRYIVATLQTTGTAGSTLNGRDFKVIVEPNVA